MKYLIGCMVWVITTCLAVPGNSQLLNRLKQKAENKLENAIDKKLDGKSQNQGQNGNTTTGGQGGNTTSSGSGSSMSQNQGGGGLISTPPDVNQNLADGDVAYKSGKYGDARYSIQQAMLGVELEIGNKILKSLPESISGLSKDAASDKVTSTGSGWAGLSIERRYTDNNSKDFRTTVVNNGAMMTALNLYFTNGGYAQQTNGQQNWKQTKIKGYRAIIEFNEGSGYKLSVPVGQSSIILFEGVNFATEADMMKAANVVDIDSIKKMLGEQ